MQQLREIVQTHPDVRGSVNEPLLQCIEDRTACADAGPAEDAVRDLVQCIRLNLDCAAVCDAAADLATRHAGSNEYVTRGMLDVCATA